MTAVRRTNRWRGVVAVALAATAVGVVAKRPLVLLAGIVGVAFAAYPRLASPPVVDLTLDRRLDDDAPAAGDPVEVTVTVTNDGDGTLWDLRVIDGVAPRLPVVEGTPRRAAVLRPGASVTFSYTVEAARGVHRFEPATVLARDPSGAWEVETTVAAETALACRGTIPGAPLRDRTGPLPGDIATDDGGDGLEFHGVRAYRRGDPQNRVDWRRLARTGELATVEFREERAASVVLCLDARAPAYRGRPGEPHAVARGIEAAEGLLDALLDTPNRVGLAVVGRSFGWLAPGAGSDHGERARRLLATHPACALQPPGEEPQPDAVEGMVDELRARLDRHAQVILLSPLLDDGAAAAAMRLAAPGHAVTVLSPDVVAPETPGGRLAAVERDNRLSVLRGADVRVIDWDPDEPLETTVARTRPRRHA